MKCMESHGTSRGKVFQDIYHSVFRSEGYTSIVVGFSIWMVARLFDSVKYKERNQLKNKKGYDIVKCNNWH